MQVFTKVRTIDLNRRRRGSAKAQGAAEIMVRGNHMSVESPVHYHHVAEMLETDPRNLKKVLDDYPGFVRIAGMPLYFYLPEFYSVAQGMGTYYPTELPYTLTRRTDIPRTVGDLPSEMVDEQEGKFVEMPITPEMRLINPPSTKLYGATLATEDIRVGITTVSDLGVKSNADIIDLLESQTAKVVENLTPVDGKLPGDPDSRFGDLESLLITVATLTRTADAS